jgi:hypothetical protein
MGGNNGMNLVIAKVLFCLESMNCGSSLSRNRAVFELTSLDALICCLKMIIYPPPRQDGPGAGGHELISKGVEI